MEVVEKQTRKTPSPKEVEASKTQAGGWTANQLAEWGIAWPPKHGWRKELERKYLAQQAGDGHEHRLAAKVDFEGKTIQRFEPDADNFWRIWFTDGTSFAIQAESSNGIPYMELCDACVNDA